MPVLRPIEMTLIDSLFGMNSGWVLDFSNPTFAEFFTHEVGVDIYDQAYERNGTSKGKRLKTFLQIGQKVAVVKALAALWEYREDARVNRGEVETVNNAKERLSAVIQRLGGSPITSPVAAANTASVLQPIVKGPTASVLAKLEEDFSDLYQLNEQARGYAFERFLKNWFDAWGSKQERHLGQRASRLMARFNMAVRLISSKPSGINPKQMQRHFMAFKEN